MPWNFLPPNLDLLSACISLGLPKKTMLRKLSVAEVCTGDRTDTTWLKLTLTKTSFAVDFLPSLDIVLPGPLADMGLGGAAYNLNTGDIKPRVWRESKIGIPVGMDTAVQGAKSFLRDLVTSTPMAIPPYNPTNDPDLILTIQQILSNLEGDGGSSIVHNIRFSAKLQTLADIVQETPEGGVRINKNTEIYLEVEVLGTPAQVRAAPIIGSALIECPGLVLRQKGQDIASIGKLKLSPGAVIEVSEVKPLGALGTVAAVESLVRLFGVLTDKNPNLMDPSALEPSLIKLGVQREIERALHKTLKDWVLANPIVGPDIDLRKALGIEGPRAPTPALA